MCLPLPKKVFCFPNFPIAPQESATRHFFGKMGTVRTFCQHFQPQDIAKNRESEICTTHPFHLSSGAPPSLFRLRPLPPHSHSSKIRSLIVKFARLVIRNTCYLHLPHGITQCSISLLTMSGWFDWFWNVLYSLGKNCTGSFVKISLTFLFKDEARRAFL